MHTLTWAGRKILVAISYIVTFSVVIALTGVGLLYVICEHLLPFLVQ